MSAAEDFNYRVALRNLGECPYHVEEVLRHGTQAEQREARVYQCDIGYHERMILAMQAIDQADKQLSASLLDEESLDMQAVYCVLDAYHYAVTLADEICVEQECIALSRIGRVYSKVLNLPTHSQIFFKRCIDLALTMRPRVLYDKDWYQLAEESLRKYQEERVRRDDREDSQRKAGIRAEIKDELEKLEEIAKISDLQEFSDALLKAFPPKRDMGKSTKRMYSLLICYSPDKQESEVHGERWTVLCEEITKKLNARNDVCSST